MITEKFPIPLERTGCVFWLEPVFRDLNLVAIEISWANFILSCGLVFTIPLFVAYLIFLFSFIPYYSSRWAILPSLFILIVTAASNGIWAKTTILSTSIAIILAFLRRPAAEDA